MRVVLLILLIAVFPLRGFASVGMQTSMGTSALHQVVAQAQSKARDASLSSETSFESACDCCEQCSVCDLCHLLVGQTPVALMQVALLQPQAPATISFLFASADVRTAHKPPLAPR